MKDTKILAPKGTHDVLPDESYIWQDIESKMMSICRNFGYNEIRFPTFEHTELFNRGVGDTTDVVQKEMYTFNDKGDRSITLRPEGTASTVRSFIEHSLYAQALPAKMCYLISCFRYERPQAGRFREFRQFGVENFGSNSPYTDAEVITLAMELLSSAGVKGLKLYINSIGCVECRKKYNEVLKNFLNSKKESLCGLCMDRIDRNPLRVLDCKNGDCQEILKDAPTVDSVLCEDCVNHFETLKKALSALGIDYMVDTGLVRGLDYYTKTVFEIKSEDLGAQSTVCGGGRYDGLIEQLGGPSTPGIGFSIGLERLISIVQKQNAVMTEKPAPTLYIASMGDTATALAFKCVTALRKNNISAEFDHLGKSVKAQMKYADKIGAKFSIVLGDDEVTSMKAKCKNMENGESFDLDINELVKGNFN